MKRQRSTARKGDPTNASRGAAVLRAKQALRDRVEQLTLRLFAHVAGIPVRRMRQRLDTATLAEIETWTAQVMRLADEALTSVKQPRAARARKRAA